MTRTETSGRATLCALMPNYNHSRHLPVALEAVLSQSRLPDHIIVLDDASTDHSLEVIRSFEGRHAHLTVAVNPENLGVVGSSNRLLHMCDCTHAIFLAADDKILPGLFETAMDLFELHPQAGLCSGLIRMLTSDGRDLGTVVTPMPLDQPGYVSPQAALRQLLAEGQWIVNNSTVYRVEALRAAGGFRPELEAFSDGLVSDILALRHGAIFVPRDLACWRMNDKGYASSTCSDLKRITRVMRHTLELMRTQFADIFPEAYRRHFATNLCKRYHPDLDLADAV